MNLFEFLKLGVVSPAQLGPDLKFFQDTDQIFDSNFRH